MRQLKFPEYEYIKSLPTVCEESEYEYEVGLPLEYTWLLFDTPTSVHARFSYNEDGSGFIFFDVMEDGYCDHEEHLNMSCKFNKKNYAKICKHAQKVYEEFYKTLDKDCSIYWEDYRS